MMEGVAKPGTICLSEDAYRQVQQRLDLKVSDLGPTVLKNIAQPVRVYSLEVGQPAERKPKAPTSETTLASFAALAAAIASLLLLVAGSGWYVLGGRLTKPAQAAHLSIVVLPFANLSGDPTQDYFADGVTENLTTELSRIRDSFIHRTQHRLRLQGQKYGREGNRQGARRSLRARRLGAARSESRSRQRPAHRRGNAALICGPTASTRTSPTSSNCKIKSWRDWPAVWAAL